MLKLDIMVAQDNVNQHGIHVTKGKNYFLRRNRRGNAIFIKDDKGVWVQFWNRHYGYGFRYRGIDEDITWVGSIYVQNWSELVKTVKDLDLESYKEK